MICHFRSKAHSMQAGTRDNFFHALKNARVNFWTPISEYQLQHNETAQKETAVRILIRHLPLPAVEIREMQNFKQKNRKATQILVISLNSSKSRG